MTYLPGGHRKLESGDKKTIAIVLIVGPELWCDYSQIYQVKS